MGSFERSGHRRSSASEDSGLFDMHLRQRTSLQQSQLGEDDEENRDRDEEGEQEEEEEEASKNSVRNSCLIIENQELRLRVEWLESLQKNAGAKRSEGMSLRKMRRSASGVTAGSESSESGDEDVRALEIEHLSKVKSMKLAAKWMSLSKRIKDKHKDQLFDQATTDNFELKTELNEANSAYARAVSELSECQQNLRASTSKHHRYEEIFHHASAEMEDLNWELEAQRKISSELREEIEQMEFRTSFAQMGQASLQDEDEGQEGFFETSFQSGPAASLPISGRLSMREGSAHQTSDLADQLSDSTRISIGRSSTVGGYHGIQKDGISESYALEVSGRAKTLIFKNLELQKRMSGLLQWRSKVTVDKLQVDLQSEADSAQGLKSQLSQAAQERQLGGEAAAVEALKQELSQASKDALARSDESEAVARAETEVAQLRVFREELDQVRFELQQENLKVAAQSQSNDIAELQAAREEATLHWEALEKASEARAAAEEECQRYSALLDAAHKTAFGDTTREGSGRLLTFRPSQASSILQSAVALRPHQAWRQSAVASGVSPVLGSPSSPTGSLSPASPLSRAKVRSSLQALATHRQSATNMWRHAASVSDLGHDEAPNEEADG
eukprot:TRINITY_DN19653_c0_g1_i1.p1 TRINITY_DN19653_c0_g1~~TRINITY_DN19653_c0_g1_i1.p1  ORF type:complete len:619 (-),score=142.78 TRINITY_DN19653_c0_g1_i1:119-1975(-)